MRIDSAWLLNTSRHQEGRPVNSVLAQNVLAHQVQCRPEFVEPNFSFLLFVAKSNRGYVVRKRVETRRTSYDLGRQVRECPN
jgi:hypothetical protein